MIYFVKYEGKTNNIKRDNSKKVICYISFKVTREFLKLTEREFQDYQGYDIDEIKGDPLLRGLLSEPHNIARALLLYKYFREKALYFEATNFVFIGKNELPQSKSTVSGENFMIWINSD